MPIYVYAPVNKDGSLGESFEWLQGIHDPILTHHPETGVPVKKQLANFNTPTKGPGLLSNDNLSKKGFTKYVKAGGGSYKKVAGQGPDRIKAPN